MAKLVAFLAKLGALFFVLELQTTYAINLQLLGGIWICQTVPSVLLALYVRLNPNALLLGWIAGIGDGHLDGMVAELQGLDLSAAHRGLDDPVLCGGQRAGAEPGGECGVEPGAEGAGAG